MSHNLTRAAGALAGLFHAKARGVTIRSHLIAVAAGSPGTDAVTSPCT